MSANVNNEKYYKIRQKPGTHLAEDKDHDGIQKGLQFSDSDNSLQGPVDLEVAFTDKDLLQFSAQEAQKEREYKLQMKALRNDQINSYTGLIRSCIEAYYAIRDLGGILYYKVWPVFNQHTIPWAKKQIRKLNRKQHIEQDEIETKISETTDIEDGPITLDDSKVASNVINFSEYQETKKESSSSAV